MSKEFDGQGIDPQLMLGSYDTTGSVAKRYERLRQEASTRMLSALSLQDSEFVRRQSDVNGEFVSEILNGIPHANFGFELDEHKTSGYGSTYHKGTLRNLAFEYVLDISSSEYSQVTGDSIAEIASFRSANIWIERPNSELVNLTHVNRYVDASIERGKTPAPHVILGHKVKPVDNEVDLLLAPNITAFRTTKSSFGEQFNRRENDVWVGKGDSLGGSIKFREVIAIIKATLPLSQYLCLLAMQDALMTEDLNDDNINRLHQPDSGKLVLSYNSIPLITAQGVKTFKFKKAPQTISGLESENFDIKIGETLPLAINPEMFAEYNMLEDAQRVCAMMGRNNVFESAKVKLIKQSLKDPALRLVEGYKS